MKRLLIIEEEQMLQELIINIRKLNDEEAIEPTFDYSWFIDGNRACIRYIALNGEEKEVCEVYEP